MTKAEAKPAKKNRILLLGFGLLAFVIFALAVLYRNFYLYQHFCQKNFDLGIFLEVIRESAKGRWNPWLHTRQIFQMSDHWTLIMTLLSPLTRIVGLINFALVGEVLFLGIAGLSLVWLVLKKKLDAGWAAILTVLFFFNRDQFEAAYFPIHESTWAAAPIMWIGAFLLLWNPRQMLSAFAKMRLFLALVVLCTFSEQFGFAWMGLALGFILFTKDRFFGFVLLFSGVVVAWFLAAGRGIIFTPIFPYLQQRILIPPEAFLEKYPLTLESVKSLALHVAGYLPGLYFLFHSTKKHKNLRSWLLVMSFLSPLLLGRLLAGNWGLHYSVALTCTWILSFLFLAPEAKPPRLFVAISFVFAFAWVNHKLFKPYETAFLHRSLECARGPVAHDDFDKRDARLKQVFASLHERIGLGRGAKILASGNLGPNLLVEFPDAQVFQFGGYEVLTAAKFDYVILEHGQFGESHYALPDRVIEAIAAIRDSGAKLLEPDEELFFVEGPVSYALVKKYYFAHPEDFITNPRAHP